MAKPYTDNVVVFVFNNSNDNKVMVVLKSRHTLLFSRRYYCAYLRSVAVLYNGFLYPCKCFTQRDMPTLV